MKQKLTPTAVVPNYSSAIQSKVFGKHVSYVLL
jgi:hypothetical protein